MNKNSWCFECPGVRALAFVIKKLTDLHDKHKDKCAQREKDKQ